MPLVVRKSTTFVPTVDVILTVTLTVPLTDAVRQAVEGAVQAWYDAGLDGAYGAPGLHWLSGPVVDTERNRLTWNVDLGSVDPEQAIEALRKRLRAVGQPPVKELILSFEPEVEG